MIRTLLVALGVAATVLGLAVVLRPSLAAGLSPAFVVVTLVGVLGLVQAAGSAMARVRGERREADLPEVERARPFPTPGWAFERTLSALPARPTPVADRDRARLRERLREVAVDVLGRYGGLDRETAEARLDRGEWTGDEGATAFFAPRTGADRSLAEWVRDAVGAERLFVRRARATVDALVAYRDDARAGEMGGDPANDNGTRNGNENGDGER